MSQLLFIFRHLYNDNSESCLVTEMSPDVWEGERPAAS